MTGDQIKFRTLLVVSSLKLPESLTKAFLSVLPHLQVYQAKDLESFTEVMLDEIDIFLVEYSQESQFLATLKEVLSLPSAPLLLGFGKDDIEAALNSINGGVYEYLAIETSESVNRFHLQKVFTKLATYPPRPILKGSKRLSRDGKVPLIVESKRMHEVMQIVRRVARFNTTVLITGESGTGKELISREIHRLSARHDTPFIAINCGAIPENLLESELFGHKKGAFTDASRDKRGLFEEANGGTLFLDEIGELPLHLQVKLLRALQERQIRRVGDEELIPIDVRLIAATLRNLEVDIQEGRFRDDLYYRLNVVTLNLPPLRERREEIPVLVKHLLQKLNARLKTRVKEVGEKAMQIFITYPWPGNVRELENCIERMMVLSDEEILDISMLPKSLKNFFGGKDGDLGVVEHIVLDNLSIKSKTKELEIALIEKALNAYKRNRTKAASVLEISHRALLYKMKEYNIS